MWFIFSMIALLCWSGSDLFSKIGCRDSKDKTSHLKMVMAVGIVMGLHALYSIFIGGIDISFNIILTYLPVSLLYILSMTLGYVGLRYIELSISSPICNSSGAVVAIATIIMFGIGDMEPLQLVAIGLVTLGVIALGIIEANEDEELRAARQEKANFKYAKSVLALALPIAYCIFDAAGTFADTYVIEKIEGFFPHASDAGQLEEMAANSANVAYELTFLAVGLVCCAILLFQKQEKFTLRTEYPKFIGAAFETIGQFFYVHAIADSAHVAMSAPIISSYCAASVLWSRIFLKEKLSWKHYISLFVVFTGIVIMGIFDM